MSIHYAWIKQGPLLKENEYPAVEALHPLCEKAIPEIMGTYLAESSDNNITMRAMRDYFELSNRYDVTNKVAFSSDRKWGAMEFPELGVVYVGAPERLVEEDRLPDSLKQPKRMAIAYLCWGSLQISN